MMNNLINFDKLKKYQHIRNPMESCTIVNRYCIKTAVTTLHNQLQSANMAPSMGKRQLFYKVRVCKIPRFIVLLNLASQLVHW